MKTAASVFKELVTLNFPAKTNTGKLLVADLGTFPQEITVDEYAQLLLLLAAYLSYGEFHTGVNRLYDDFLTAVEAEKPEVFQTFIQKNAVPTEPRILQRIPVQPPAKMLPQAERLLDMLIQDLYRSSADEKKTKGFLRFYKLKDCNIRLSIWNIRSVVRQKLAKIVTPILLLAHIEDLLLEVDIVGSGLFDSDLKKNLLRLLSEVQKEIGERAKHFPSPPKDGVFQLAVIGDVQSGKSALVAQLKGEPVSSKPVPQTSHQFTVLEKDYRVKIWDFAGAHPIADQVTADCPKHHIIIIVLDSQSERQVNRDLLTKYLTEAEAWSPHSSICVLLSKFDLVAKTTLEDLRALSRNKNIMFRENCSANTFSVEEIEALFQKAILARLQVENIIPLLMQIEACARDVPRFANESSKQFPHDLWHLDGRSLPIKVGWYLCLSASYLSDPFEEKPNALHSKLTPIYQALISRVAEFYQRMDQGFLNLCLKNPKLRALMPAHLIPAEQAASQQEEEWDVLESLRLQPIIKSVQMSVLKYLCRARFEAADRIADFYQLKYPSAFDVRLEIIIYEERLLDALQALKTPQALKAHILDLLDIISGSEKHDIELKKSISAALQDCQKLITEFPCIPEEIPHTLKIAYLGDEDLRARLFGELNTPRLFTSLGKRVVPKFIEMANPDMVVDGIFNFLTDKERDALLGDPSIEPTLFPVLNPAALQIPIYCFYTDSADPHLVVIKAYGTSLTERTLKYRWGGANDDSLPCIIDHIHALQQWSKQIALPPQWLVHNHIIKIAGKYILSCRNDPSFRTDGLFQVLADDLLKLHLDSVSRLLVEEPTMISLCQRVFGRMTFYFGSYDYDHKKLNNFAKSLFPLYLQLMIRLIRECPEFIVSIISSSLTLQKLDLAKIVEFIPARDCFVFPVPPYRIDYITKPTFSQIFAVYSTENLEAEFSRLRASFPSDDRTERFDRFCSSIQSSLLGAYDAKQYSAETISLFDRVRKPLEDCLYRHSNTCDFPANRPDDRAVKHSRRVIGTMAKIFDPEGSVIQKDFTGLAIRESLEFFALILLKWCDAHPDAVNQLEQIPDRELQENVCGRCSVTLPLLANLTH